MTKPPADIAAEIERLQSLATETLRYERRRHHQTPPPKRLSRELLLRGITYRIHDRAFGGLSRSVLRRIGGTTEPASGASRMAPRTIVKPGTRLVREWNGQTQTVLVHADGVEWRGRRYRSLSVVARAITGAHWSGPRFFGLSSKKGVGDG